MEEESRESRNTARLAIMELANMISVPMSLNAIVRLNVPDAIWEGGSNTPLSAAQIVARVQPSGDPENLQRILRMLTSYGVFQEHLTHSERKYSLTEIGKTLVTDADGLSYGPYVLQHHQDALMGAWPLVHEAVVDPTCEPFVKANGEPAYGYYGKRPEMNGLMQKAMSGVSVPFVTALLDGYDGFGGVQRLVDVGGSAGDCLRMILRKHPHVREGINFDLPEVVAKAPQIPRMTHVGGNMFESIPAADAIFMKWILTTWTDDEVKLIMENCYKALPVGGKMIVCEPVLPEKTDESHRTRALLEGDIFVMTIYRAKENILGKLGYLVHEELRLVLDIKSKLTDLQGTMTTIKAVLLDAEEKQASNRALRIWLRLLKDIFYDAEDVLDGVECEVLRKQVVRTHGCSSKEV